LQAAKSAVTSLHCVDGSGTGPLVVPFAPPVLQQHVAPGSVHVTV